MAGHRDGQICPKSSRIKSSQVKSSQVKSSQVKSSQVKSLALLSVERLSECLTSQSVGLGLETWLDLA